MRGIRRSIPRSFGDAVRLAGEEGQGLVEYALILLFVAVAIVGSLGAFGGGLDARYQAIASTVASL
jgi:Flp pilus assembly pilin Flp